MTEQELIALWHGDELAEDIARRLGIRSAQLIVAWRRLKHERKLPPGDRPRNTSSGRIEQPSGEQYRVAGDDDEFLRLLNTMHPERRR